MSILTQAQPALAATVWPADARPLQQALRFALLAILGVIFIALCAQVRVPFYPVPMTGQTFAVLLVGTVFGWRLGLTTLLLYMGAGAIGIPVFAKWSAGPGVIAGATGGYIIGFVLAPNVNALIEMMDFREAQQSYQANLSVLEVSKRMIVNTIDILRG